jgi:hypothetical protein
MKMADKEPKQEIVTLAEAKDALRRSGYLLENRLDSVLREWGYVVYANRAYPDPIEKKSRELDILAEKSFEALEPVVTATHHITQWVFSVLLIECQNNVQPIAFFSKEPQFPHIDHYEIKMAGIPVIIKEREDGPSALLCDFLNMNKYHHYCSGRIATQFCSFKAKGDKRGKIEWMAWHEDSHFASFQKLAAALEHNVQEQASCHKIGGVNIEIYYPLVVLQGQLLEVVQRPEEVELRPSDHARLVFSQVINGKHSNYHVDSIKESFFLNYLKMIELEMSRTVRQIKRKRAHVDKSLEILLSEVEKANNQEEVRGILGF